MRRYSNEEHLSGMEIAFKQRSHGEMLMWSGDGQRDSLAEGAGVGGGGQGEGDRAGPEGGRATGGGFTFWDTWLTQGEVQLLRSGPRGFHMTGPAKHWKEAMPADTEREGGKGSHSEKERGRRVIQR